MTGKPVLLRQRAVRDADEALEYYFAEGGRSAALGFVGALEKAYAHIARYPDSGSLRYAHDLNLPGLRSWPLKRFPYLVFYVVQPGNVDVWRVLHAGRDIPVWMGESDGV